MYLRSLQHGGLPSHFTEVMDTNKGFAGDIFKGILALHKTTADNAITNRLKRHIKGRSQGEL